MYVHISRWQTFDFGTLSYLIVNRWHRWHLGRRWRQFWWRCTPSFAPPARLHILRCANLARNTAIHLIFTNHCRVSFHRSLHRSMPRELNFPLLLFWDFGARFVDQVLHSLYCSARKLSFGQLGPIQGKSHVGLFELYPTSFPRPSSWHVQTLQEICCCIQQWDLTIATTIYDSLASSEGFEAIFFHSGPLTTKLLREYPRADIIVMFDFTDCVDKCFGPQWRFPITGSFKLVM